MTTTPQNCAECGRPLLLSDGAEMCCYRHCPAYGQDQSDNEPDDPQPQPKTTR
jgi:hypothetical protein